MYLCGGSLSAESTWDLQGIVVRCKTWNLAISVALSVLVVTTCSPGWHPVRLSKDTLIWTPEKADNVLESDSDADDVDDDKTPNTFIGLYEDALERLLASTETVGLCKLDAGLERSADDAFRTYVQFCKFFPDSLFDKL